MRCVTATSSVTAYGVDGCKAGWFFIALGPSGEIDWGIVRTVGELVKRADDSDRIFIDIPIGLPDGAEDRICDKEARRKLGSRRASSVFPAPARSVLSAGSYEKAKRNSQVAAGKAVSQQTFAILPKIGEVDGLLRGCAKARRIVREVHPEICFWALAGEKPMVYRKKDRKGRDERRAALERLRPSAGREFEQILNDFLRRDLAPDDILDAMAAAITASADSAAVRTLPERPARDCCGLPMEMVYAPGASFAA